MFEDKRKENLVIIAKITSCCNLNCVYCYDQKFREEDSEERFLPLEKLDMLLEMASKYAKVVELILHGGEPTLAGTEYIRALMRDIIPKYEDCNITVSMQSNGTLINDDLIDILTEYDLSMGISYNALHEEQRYRNNEKEIVLTNMDRLKEAEINFGIIDVITNTSFSDIEKIADFYKQKELPYALNLAYSTPNGDNSFLISADGEYFKSILSYFKKWVRDEDAIFDRFASQYVENLLIGQSQICHYSGRCFSDDWFSINANGKIFICDNDFSDKYLLARFDEISCIEDIFESSAYWTCKEQREKKFSFCEEICDFFAYCKGGCPSNDIITHGTAEKADMNACELFKANLLAAYIALDGLTLEEANPILRNFILLNNSILPGEINELLRYINIPEDKLRYSFDPRISDPNFEIFKVFNNPVLEERIIKSISLMEPDMPEECEDRRFENILLALKEKVQE